MPDDRADFDYRGYGKVVRALLEADGRGWRVNAAEIGVTAADLSRLCAGQPLAYHKIVAIAAWSRVDAAAFYEPPPTLPARKQCFTGPALKQEAR